MNRPAVAEKAFRQQVLELAQLYGWRCYWTWTSIHSPAGFPDLVLVRPPRLVIAELKTETGKLTAAQETWLVELAQTSVETAVWHPSDWEKIVTILAR